MEPSLPAAKVLGNKSSSYRPISCLTKQVCALQVENRLGMHQLPVLNYLLIVNFIQQLNIILTEYNTWVKWHTSRGPTTTTWKYLALLSSGVASIPGTGSAFSRWVSWQTNNKKVYICTYISANRLHVIRTNKWKPCIQRSATVPRPLYGASWHYRLCGNYRPISHRFRGAPSVSVA